MNALSDKKMLQIQAVFKSCKRKTQNFCKSLAWCTKYSQKINRITKMDCKSRDESNKPT